MSLRSHQTVPQNQFAKTPDLRLSFNLHKHLEVRLWLRLNCLTHVTVKQDSYILAIDQGTTSSRSIIFDQQCRQVALSQKEYQQIYPRPGWVEHDPTEIWSSQISTLGEAMARADLSPRNIAAIGITNQRETTIVWDKSTGKPIYNAIVWQDRRTADFCKSLFEQGHEPIVRQKTGLRLDPYFSATKIRWILDHVDGAKQGAAAGKLLFGTVDSWLVWKLSDGKLHLTDATNAARTLLYNIHTQRWDEDLLDMFGIPATMLPEIRSCSEIYGKTSDGHISLAGIAGDQHAALFGQACFEQGMAKNTYGTGCFLLMNTGTTPVESKNNLLTTIAWQLNGQTEYALEGSVFIGGAIVQWLRDELGLIRSAKECDQLASMVVDSNGLYIVPAFAGLGAPHWDPYARGTAFGMTRGTNRQHFCRAALDAIAFQSYDLATAMQSDSGIPIKQLRVDGGASKSQPLMQFQADLLQTSVVRPKNSETTALGAAYLAGLAVGFWADKEEITAHWEIDQTFTPQQSPTQVSNCLDGWNRAIERTRDWQNPS